VDAWYPSEPDRGLLPLSPNTTAAFCDLAGCRRMAWLKAASGRAGPRRARVSDVAPGGGRRGRRALDGRGPPPRPAMTRRKPEPAAAAVTGRAHAASRSARLQAPGLPAVVPQATGPAVRPVRRAPGRLRLSSCPGRHHGGPPPPARTSAATSAPAGAAVPPQPPVLVFPADHRLHRGTAPAQGAPATPRASRCGRRRPGTGTRTRMPPLLPATAPARSQTAARVRARLQLICRIYSRCRRRTEHDHEAFFV
jgi:hypothetical protein